MSNLSQIPEVDGLRAAGYEADCLHFNAEVRSSLPKPQAMGAAVVMLAARWSVPSLWESAGEPWDQESSRTVGEIRAAGLDVVLAADIPDFPRSVPECLARLKSVMCGRRRDEVERDIRTPTHCSAVIV